MSNPIEAVAGIGPKTAEYLRSKRVTSVQALIKYGAAKLAEAPGLGLARAEAAIKSAEEILAGGTAVAKPAVKKSTPAASKPEKKGKKQKKDKKEKKAKKDKKDKKQKKNKKDKKNKKNKK